MPEKLNQIGPSEYTNKILKQIKWLPLDTLKELKDFVTNLQKRKTNQKSVFSDDLFQKDNPTLDDIKQMIKWLSQRLLLRIQNNIDFQIITKTAQKKHIHNFDNIIDQDQWFFEVNERQWIDRFTQMHNNKN